MRQLFSILTLIFILLSNKVMAQCNFDVSFPAAYIPLGYKDISGPTVKGLRKPILVSDIVQKYYADNTLQALTNARANQDIIGLDDITLIFSSSFPHANTAQPYSFSTAMDDKNKPNIVSFKILNSATPTFYDNGVILAGNATNTVASSFNIGNKAIVNFVADKGLNESSLSYAFRYRDNNAPAGTNSIWSDALHIDQTTIQSQFLRVDGIAFRKNVIAAVYDNQAESPNKRIDFTGGLSFTSNNGSLLVKDNMISSNTDALNIEARNVYFSGKELRNLTQIMFDNITIDGQNAMLTSNSRLIKIVSEVDFDANTLDTIKKLTINKDYTDLSTATIIADSEIRYGADLLLTAATKRVRFLDGNLNFSTIRTLDTKFLNNDATISSNKSTLIFDSSLLFSNNITGIGLLNVKNIDFDNNSGNTIKLANGQSVLRMTGYNGKTVFSHDVLGIKKLGLGLLTIEAKKITSAESIIFASESNIIFPTPYPIISGISGLVFDKLRIDAGSTISRGGSEIVFEIDTHSMDLANTSPVENLAELHTQRITIKEDKISHHADGNMTLYAINSKINLNGKQFLNVADYPTTGANDDYLVSFGAFKKSLTKNPLNEFGIPDGDVNLNDQLVYDLGDAVDGTDAVNFRTLPSRPYVEWRTARSDTAGGYKYFSRNDNNINVNGDPCSNFNCASKLYMGPFLDNATKKSNTYDKVSFELAAANASHRVKVSGINGFNITNKFFLIMANLTDDSRAWRDSAGGNLTYDKKDDADCGAFNCYVEYPDDIDNGVTELSRCMESSIVACNGDTECRGNLESRTYGAEMMGYAKNLTGYCHFTKGTVSTGAAKKPSSGSAKGFYPIQHEGYRAEQNVYSAHRIFQPNTNIFTTYFAISPIAKTPDINVASLAYPMGFTGDYGSTFIVICLDC